MNFRDALKDRILFFDGGTGTVLQSMGLVPGELPESWNVSHPERITGLHYDYFAAGANIIKTNTFGASSGKFPEGSDMPLSRVVASAMKCARDAREAYESSGEEFASSDHFIALDIGPCGKLLEGLGDMPFEDAVGHFAEVIRAGAKDADLVLIETMNDALEAKAAVIAARENCDLPIVVTTVYDERGKSMTGSDVMSMVTLLEGLRVDALGTNCSLGVDEMKKTLAEMLKVADTPIAVNPNAGMPHFDGRNTFYDLSPADFASGMLDMAKMGASLIGGCCGTTPEHIREMVRACSHVPKKYLPKHNITSVSSRTRTVTIGERPVIIGERINPTGKPKMKEALRSGNFDYIVSEGLDEESAGADILDVNVGLPEIDERACMLRAVCELEEVTGLPLQIDTSDFSAMEAAMRRICGKPLINSVCGKEESMRAIFPLVQKYGGVVVALTLDENGIPDSIDGRMAIAEKIYVRAGEYGIERKDIIIDPLAMSVSADRSAADITLATLRRIRDAGGKTILGVSNVSFGLPKRELINSSFFTLALGCGLSAAIINPMSHEMMRAYQCYLTLSGRDRDCADYIRFASGYETSAVATKGCETKGCADDGTLGVAIERGLSGEALRRTSIMLETISPLDIINLHLIPALNRVGRGFEEKTVYLPELLMSAEAAKCAFGEIKAHLAKSGSTSEKRGEIILATVKGDIHDIGKNIVRVLLENYGFDVIDLGRDVPPEVIADECVRRHVRLVGLSALMTTTVPAMAETIKLLRSTAPWCKIAVGGAVLTQEYADMIGADSYSRDAMQMVNIAEEIFAKAEK